MATVRWSIYKYKEQALVARTFGRCLWESKGVESARLPRVCGEVPQVPGESSTGKTVEKIRYFIRHGAHISGEMIQLLLPIISLSQLDLRLAVASSCCKES